MFCEIEEEALLARGHEICKMLVPLAGRSQLAYCVTSNRSGLTIGVHSGSRPDLNVTDWRFSTVVRGIRAGYHERWIAVDEKRQRFYIERAYLHLYRRRLYELDETEIVALHCDPNEADDDDDALLKHAVYKRGPHIHVSAAEQPFPHSHLALNATQVDEVLSSIESLHSAVQSGIVLLRDQVLDLLDVHGL
jgi:hypothetical protein